MKIYHSERNPDLSFFFFLSLFSLFTAYVRLASCVFLVWKEKLYIKGSFVFLLDFSSSLLNNYVPVL